MNNFKVGHYYTDKIENEYRDIIFIVSEEERKGLFDCNIIQVNKGDYEIGEQFYLWDHNFKDFKEVKNYDE